MPSEKLVRILRAKSDLPLSQIEAMSEADGWNWVYANAKPHKERLSQVCFTGFQAAEKARLAALAASAHLDVASTVTKSLAFLCAGANAGPAKLAKAREQGVHILSESEFLHLIETGEVGGA